MKTNKLRTNRISILFSLTALLFFPFISNAQLRVSTTGGVTVGDTTTTATGLQVLGGNVGINTASPTSILHTIASGAKTANYTGNTLTNTSTSSTASIVKTGLDIQSTGTWTGTSAINIGLNLDVSGGTTNYAAILQGGNVGVGINNPQRKLVVSSSGNEGMEIHPFSGYCQMIAYKRSVTAAYVPLVLQDAAGGNVGIGTTSPGSKLDVNGTSNFTGNMTITGNVAITGNGTYSGTWMSSDAMFKTNVDSLQNALDIIRQLKPKSYYFDTVNFADFNFVSNKQYGFIAQDLEQILPELVSTNIKNAKLDSLGVVIYPTRTFKAVNYIDLIGILAKGIQEMDIVLSNRSIIKQDSVIQALNSKIEDLENQIASCCSNIPVNNANSSMTGNINGNGINDVSSKAPILYQNIPNPFNQQTSIQYFIPASSKTASIMVFDLNGKLMSTVPVTSFGKGAVTINGSQLSPGMFVYSLVVDQKIIDTKRMILTN